MDVEIISLTAEGEEQYVCSSWEYDIMSYSIFKINYLSYTLLLRYKISSFTITRSLNLFIWL
jgi:hypothetical protein